MFSAGCRREICIATRESGCGKPLRLSHSARIPAPVAPTHVLRPRVADHDRFVRVAFETLASAHAEDLRVGLGGADLLRRHERVDVRREAEGRELLASARQPCCW